MSHFWILLISLVLSLCCQQSDASGTSFAVACPPARSGDLSGYCKVYVNSASLGNVWYSTANSTEVITLWPELTRVFSFSPDDYRTTVGVEDKAIYVYSDVEMTVSVANSDDSALMDSTLVLPLNLGVENRYFIMSYPTSATESLCSLDSPTSSYTVVASEDDTTLSIYRFTASGSGLIDTITLNRWQTYTNSSMKTSDSNTQQFDLTGYYIETDRPVSVLAGNPCTDSVSGNRAAPILSSMPAVQNLGTRYRSHPITYPEGNGNSYLIRVLAVSDVTTVNFRREMLSVELLPGTSYDLLVDDNQEVEVVECSLPCMVSQQSQFHDQSAIFMTILPSEKNYVSDALFSFADQSSSELNRYLSIIYDTTEPEQNELLLNGQDLSALNWVIHPLEFSYLEFPMLSSTPEVYNRLTSSNPNVKFAALVHGQGSFGTGYGFMADSFVLTNGTEPDRNETEPPPLPNQNYTYLINMGGEFVSSTGEAFTEVCTLQYSVSMQDEADRMVAEVNGEIGQSLCPDLSTSVVQVQSVSAPLTTNGNTGYTSLEFRLRVVLGEYGPPEIEACTAQLDAYLMSHSNWGEPILDPEPGCPGVQFTSNSFNDTGNEWICQGLKQPPFPDHQAPEAKKASSWVYSIQHIGDFASSDGATIPSSCLTEHNRNFQSSTEAAVAQVNSMLAGGGFCELTTVQLLLDSAIISSTGNVGLSYQQYYMDYPAGVDSAALGVCATTVSQYLADHDNWAQPILPPVTDCSDLVFDPQEFLENQLGWFCVDN